MLSIFDEEFARDPWQVLRSLRDGGGAHRVATPDGPPAWLVTRYSDVREGLLDARLSTNLRYSAGADYRGFAVPEPLDVFQRSDLDELARLRGRVTGQLRRAGEWSGQAGKLMRERLAELDGAGDFDFVEQVALPLPALILGELLGLPDVERDALARWAAATLRPEAAPRARDTLATMAEIVEAVIAHGRAGSADTMLGRLVRDESHGPAADSGELPGLLFYLLFVWYEVLMDVLAGAVLTLSGRPDQLAAVRTAAESAAPVDELLRFLSPQVLAGPRFAVTDLVIGGKTVAAGETVLLCLAAANHDPERFADPGVLDLARTPNPHVALGHGAHACVGAGLLRPVLGAVLAELYGHWPGLHATVAEREVRWRSGFRHRGPLRLPVHPGATS
ncbi:cytochrome P450 [Nocardia sp. NPDC057668]|uniref:cytochrome P450 n=1 Tax=Nocardia sp. NPDC057668 TaxID=3346202 RepID=UPI00366ED312